MHALKYGRRRDLLSADRPKPKLKALLTGVVPSHPASDDNLARLNGGWQMLGNDQYGDCVAVTWANERRLVSTILGSAEYPSLNQVYQFYKTQNPNFPSEDNGMDIQTALDYLVQHGGPDGVKALGYAAVDHTNPDEVKAAIALFGSVWTGLIVYQNNMDEFNSNQPWSWDSASFEDGGHSVVTGGYGAGTGVLGGDEKFITWAQETSFTDSFWANSVEEAWVVVWPEMLNSKEFLAGINLQQLAADYKEITGKDFPAVVPPTPTPTPTPVPPKPKPQPPTPTPSWWEELIAWIESLFA